MTLFSDEKLILGGKSFIYILYHTTKVKSLFKSKTADFCSFDILVQ